MKLARAFSPSGKLCQASSGSCLVSVFFLFCLHEKADWPACRDTGCSYRDLGRLLIKNNNNNNNFKRNQAGPVKRTIPANRASSPHINRPKSLTIALLFDVPTVPGG